MAPKCTNLHRFLTALAILTRGTAPRYIHFGTVVAQVRNIARKDNDPLGPHFQAHLRAARDTLAAEGILQLGDTRDYMQFAPHVRVLLLKKLMPMMKGLRGAGPYEKKHLWDVFDVMLGAGVRVSRRGKAVSKKRKAGDDEGEYTPPRKKGKIGCGAEIGFGEGASTTAQPGVTVFPTSGESSTTAQPVVAALPTSGGSSPQEPSLPTCAATPQGPVPSRKELPGGWGDADSDDDMFDDTTLNVDESPGPTAPNAPRDCLPGGWQGDTNGPSLFTWLRTALRKAERRRDVVARQCKSERGRLRQALAKVREIKRQLGEEVRRRKAVEGELMMERREREAVVGKYWATVVQLSGVQTALRAMWRERDARRAAVVNLLHEFMA